MQYKNNNNIYLSQNSYDDYYDDKLIQLHSIYIYIYMYICMYVYNNEFQIPNIGVSKNSNKY
jgi:hypothetical protein